MNQHEETVELNRSQSQEYNLPCGRCLVPTSHKVLSSADVSGSYLNEGVDYWEQYQIVQCQGCKTISFRKCFSDSESVDHYEQPDGTVVSQQMETIELYPSRIAGRNKLKRSWSLPQLVSRIYDETHAALSNRLPILGGIGIRALIEAVCKEKKTNGSTLKDKIDDLVQKGTLTFEAATILHKLRDLGNESAHEVTPLRTDVLEIALDVVENLLQSVYILPKVAANLDKHSKL